VAVIGTGSSGVQSIPLIAEQAGHLYIFQRSAAFTRPANNRPLRPGELDELKHDYANIREAERKAHGGILRFGAISNMDATPPDRRILETPVEERLRVVDDLGWSAPLAWADVMTDLDANQAGTKLYAELIRRVVKDPEVAASLVPDYPLGCKRPILDTGYFETFNRDNVTLVDLKKGLIARVTSTGVQTEQGHFEVDVIVYATGFDAMTGALNRIDIRGRGGKLLRDYWAEEGPKAYLGIQVAGFPNLFTITGPGSPSVLCNMAMATEQHAEWIADCLDFMREHGYDTVEPAEEAQEAWVEHAASVVSKSPVRTAPSCSSWYLGANVPGKKRVFMPYIGGMPAYRKKCEEIVTAGFEGFSFGKARSRRT
jgi:cyclohexanone monooxygenase